MSYRREVGADEEAIVQSVMGISKLLWAEFRQIAAEHGLSDSLAGTLWQVHRAGQIKPSDLARNMSCDMGNLCGSLDRLEEAGLVERVTSGADRRVRLMQLTTKGEKLAGQMKSDFKNSMIHERLGRMSSRERAALSEALTKLYAELSANASHGEATPAPHMRRMPA
jgi:DNA-binding MarR family transcriptional regulator